MSQETQTVAVLPSKGHPLHFETRPIPTVVPGSAIIKVHSAAVYPGTKGMHSEKSIGPLTTPIVPGNPVVGRVHALGSDSTSLRVGQLVLGDFFIRSRDDPNATILQAYLGSINGKGMKLMEDEWRDGAYAEYVKLPLEAIYPLNEEILVNQMGYSLADLNKLALSFITIAGFMEIGVTPGDSVIVAPATGYFGGDAVHVGIALGLHVIAASRSKDKLAELETSFMSSGQLTTVQLSGDVEKDTAALKGAGGSGEGVDAYVDWSPPTATGTTHVTAALMALRPFGKVALMGSISGNIEIPYFYAMFNSLRFQGQYMYDRHHALQVIKMAERGTMKLGPGEGSGWKVQGTYKLKEANEAIEAANGNGYGKLVILEP